MQAEGILPPPGSDEWDQFTGQAEAGDVAIAVVVLLRDREPALDPRLTPGQAMAVAAPKPVESEAEFLKRLHRMVHESGAS